MKKIFALFILIFATGAPNTSAESFGSDCKFITTQPSKFVYHLELVNKNNSQKDALCRIVTSRIENYNSSVAKIISMTEYSLDISVSNGDKFTVYVEKDWEAVSQYFEHPIVATETETDTVPVVVPTPVASTNNFSMCTIIQESLKDGVYQFSPWDIKTKKCNSLCFATDARIENYSNSKSEIIWQEACKIEVSTKPGDKFTLYLEKDGETISRYVEVQNKDDIQCQNYSISWNGKFSVELLDQKWQRNANCRFVQYDYKILQGNTKLIWMNEYALIFDASQDSKIRIETTSPSNYWAEFNINASSKSDDNIVQTPSSLSITSKRLPPAGYEDKVLTLISTYTSPFSDINTNSIEGKAATELYRRAVIGGFSDGEFKGSQPVNRAEAAKFLLLAKWIDVQELKNNGKFWDIKEDEWYVKYVVAAAKNSIINGYPDGSFRPANTVNTAELLKMLTLAFNLQTNQNYLYTDVKSNDWFAQYAGIALKYDLFPDRVNTLIPGKQLSRNEVAVAIYQYLLNR